jgi:hypothetical protein
VINPPGVAIGTPASIPAAVRFTGELGYGNNGYGAGTVYNGSGFLGLNLFGDNGGGGAASSSYTAGYLDRITDNNVDRLFRIEANQNGNVYVPVDTRPPGTRESYRVGETVEAMITFLTGVPFDVTTRLVANGRASVGDSGRLDWFSSALNSAAWDGFGDVLIGGVTYTDFTAIDQFSGLNLREPVRVENGVPAPGALWLFGVGLPLLGGVAWSRRRGAGGQRAVDAVA